MLSEIIKNAEKKFGTVIAVMPRKSQGYRIAIKRGEHPFKDKPYMTTVAHDNSPNDFFWSSYDLTKEEALRDLSNG